MEQNDDLCSAGRGEKVVQIAWWRREGAWWREGGRERVVWSGVLVVGGWRDLITRHLTCVCIL